MFIITCDAFLQKKDLFGVEDVVLEALELAVMKMILDTLLMTMQVKLCLMG